MSIHAGIPALTLSLFVAACRPTDATKDAGFAGHDHGEDAAAHAPVYYCPMHPSYRSDRPGNCPICNMTLVRLEEGGAAEVAGPTASHATITLAPERAQLIGVRTGLVRREKTAKTIHAVGRIEVDERRLAAVTTKFSGFVEELHVKAVGDVVKPGDPLFTCYSPELFEAQRSYLVAKRALPADDPTVASARERLLLLDLTNEQITALEALPEPDRRTTILSRYAGTVVKRDVTLGSALEAGKELFEIADLSSVWVVVDVYGSELPFIRAGDEATLVVDGVGGEPRKGRVDYVYPTLNETARTARARIDVTNSDGALKPGMYAEATLAADLGEQLVVDADAILDTGVRQLVFVSSADGKFEPREVTLGDRSDGKAVVQKGLAEGERVVTSGNFLIDSESRLQAALHAHASGTPDASSAPPAGHEHH
jgi:Cu(I)/Ag(I) efflux system membrane fusion protein